MEVEVDAVVPVVVDKAVIEVLETLEDVLVELMTLDEVALVEGELTLGVALVELEIADGEVTTEGVLVVFDKTDDDEVMLGAIGVEEFETKGFVKELAELVGKIVIELLLPKLEKTTVDEALDDEKTKLEGLMLWLVTTLVEVISDPDELVMSLGKAVIGGNSEADEPILWLVIRSVEEASGLEEPAV